MTTNQEIAVREVPKIIAAIDERLGEFKRALPRHIPAPQFVRIVKTAISMNRELLECAPADLLNECMKAAADGLVLDGREATLTIYNTKRKVKTDHGFEERWIKTPKYIPMFVGLIKRARNSGELKAISVFLVGENEVDKINPRTKKPHFRRWVDSTGEHIEYEPMTKGDPGPVTGGFSCAKLAGGVVDFCWMPIAEIRKIQQRTRSRKKSKNKQTGEDTTVIVGPWKTDESEMMKKTIIRRHSKTLPMNSDLARVFSRDDDLYDPDGGDDAPIPAAARPREREGVAAERLNDPPPAKGKGAAPAEGEIFGPEVDGDESPAPRPVPAKGKAAAKPKPRQTAPAEDADTEEYDGDAI